MRKNQPRNYLKLAILLLGICIFITSCQKDDYDRTHEAETFVEAKLHLKIQSYAEMANDTKFNGALEKISRLSNPKNKGNFQSKTVMEEQYGFLIDSSIIKQVDIDNFTSYTMLITREVDSTHFFENLVLQIDSLEQISAYIIKYYPAPDQTYNEHHDSYSLDAEFHITPIIYNGSESEASKMVYGCTELYSVECNGGDEGCNESYHPVGQACYDYTSECIGLTQTGQSCGYYDDGSGGGGGSGGDAPPDPGNPNTGGGGTGDGGTPVITAPTPPCTGINCPEALDTECEKITQLFQDYSTLLNALQTNKGQTGLLQERGVYVVDNSTVPQNPPIGDDGAVELDAPSGNYICFSHTHNSPASTTYSVPSFQDLADGIVKLVKLNRLDANRFVGFLFTADGTSYAFTIKDINAFNQFWSRPGEPGFNFEQLEKRSQLITEYYSPYNPEASPLIKENGNDNVGDLKHFLDFINDSNMGLTFFEESDNFTTFKQLKHNKKDNIVDKTPCN